MILDRKKCFTNKFLNYRTVYKHALLDLSIFFSKKKYKPQTRLIYGELMKSRPISRLTQGLALSPRASRSAVSVTPSFLAAAAISGGIVVPKAAFKASSVIPSFLAAAAISGIGI